MTCIQFGVKACCLESFLMFSINLCFVNSLPSLKWNRQPGLLPLSTMFASKAVIGQASGLALPTTTSTPFQNGSVLEAFSLNLSTCGLAIQSIETSARQRCTAGSNAVSVGTVSSPALRKPKKQVHAATQTITES